MSAMYEPNESTTVSGISSKRPTEEIVYTGERSAMISAGMEELALQIGILEKSFHGLYNRLAAVLRPYGDDDAVPSEPGLQRVRCDSDLAEGLRERIDQIMRVRRNIDGATERVDL